ncbi:hypothetical protein G6F57_021448 [Rhizopus arrhizus]|nr:hypothetical protein G6F57_021448 [Rhizopus arrhizus]
MQQTSRGPPLKAGRVDAAAIARTQVAPTARIPAAGAGACRRPDDPVRWHPTPIAPCAGIACRAATASTPLCVRAWRRRTMTDNTYRAADLAGAGDALRAGGERVPTWITKEAGNRRLPFDAERLQRSIDTVHAEFPQLDCR